MGNINMKRVGIKFVLLYLLVIFLSVLHVHCSIDTQDNPLNPSTLILMLIYSMQLTHEVYEMIFFYSVQFVITAIISSILLKYRSIIIWLLDYVLVLILCICIGFNYWDICNSLDGLYITNVYGDYYGYGSAAFTNCIVCTILQLLVLLIYPFLSYLRSCIGK